MSENPIFALLPFFAAAYFLYLWIQDKKSNEKSQGGSEGGLPGAYPASLQVIGIAMIGAILIVILATVAEFSLGVSDQQSTIKWWFLAAMLGAGIIEEIIFRGFLVVTKRGEAALISSIVLFSFVFAIVHPYIWTNIHEDPSLIESVSGLRLDISTHAILSTAYIFVLSLWFYFCRFNNLNKTRSLLPCFVAHCSANVTVFAIKGFSGYIS